MEHNREFLTRERHETKDKRTTKTTRQLIVEEERGDINELADAFVKNTRNQLKIQRDESFKHYQETVARGV
ncbi:hypothetical protein CICLE_v10017520mg [Citrus x clementina]|uniref:Uncharacterized protein n=2 Tax=Citrus TaxID=2706 RepID=A0A067FIG8_CITSI|nr:hypothetical protein CICLE_v10017520mg [Citrus x clementina]KDO63006.1 hypothetical protein CISIN_1g041453mg [Citrus sinensis]